MISKFVLNSVLQDRLPLKKTINFLLGICADRTIVILLKKKKLILKTYQHN